MNRSIRTIHTTILSVLLLLTTTARAQIEQGGTPHSLQRSLPPDLGHVVLSEIPPRTGRGIAEEKC